MDRNKELIPQFVIAATSSGCGKTTISLGLMRLCAERGMIVRPFKCGPDYIDPIFHKQACGNDSINLDLFMGSEKEVMRQYSTYSINGNIAIVEGVMGLFDGYDKWKGSTAQIASTLNLPVILIINATSTAYSVAAIILGFKNLCKDIDLGGVIFNNVSSVSHFNLLLDACNDVGVKCFGYVLKNAHLKMPSRHLGLQIGNQIEIEKYITSCAEAIKQGIDLDAIVDALNRPQNRINETIKINEKKQKLSIAVAKDDAFSFIYKANLDAWRNHPKYNIHITFFSPLNDTILPECDLLYFPGGYPELYAEKLSSNTKMKDAIRKYFEQGGNILAECGGMIYLSQNLDEYEMCGLFPLKISMKNCKLHLGYRKLKFNKLDLRGHEFHYSEIVGSVHIPSIAKQYTSRGTETSTQTFRIKNAIAGYTHLYWADTDILKLWNL